MMDGQDVEVGASKSVTRYLERKESFKGFKKVDGQGTVELGIHLGISVPGVRTFQYEGEPKFAFVRRVLGRLDQHAGKFIDHPAHRGSYDAHQDAVFVKPGDSFAEIHELGHAFAEKNNSGLEDFCADGRMGSKGVEERVAAIALEEGMAQWMAIATGSLTKDPQRVREATLESNKLVADGSVGGQFDYSPEAIAQRLATVKRLVADYAKNPAIKRSGNPIVAQEQYGTLIGNDDLYRGLMSLGYVYTLSRLAEEPMIGKKTAEVLADIIKVPPTFAEMEAKVLGFNGQVDFKGLIL